MMKKITLLFMMAGATAFAQQSYTEMDGVVTQGATIETTITYNNDRNPLVGTYTDQTDFDDALAANCTDTSLTFEDFMGGPGAITTCGPIINSSDGGACFGAGELEDGFDAQASNGTDVVFIPNGAIGNSTELVGANTFAEFSIFNFDPNVYAISMEIWNNADPNTDVRIYGDGGALIESVVVASTVGTQAFFGIISDEVITAIEVEEQNGGGDLVGVLSYGADCMVLGVNDNALSQVTLYPNPASDIVNIQLPISVEVESIAVYDVLGKVVANRATNNQIDVSQFNDGVYMVNIETNQGTVTRKIIKR
ncbi:MAG: T9SS type A sorting domain-containing protein [Bacteroidota bacterium]